MKRHRRIYVETKKNNTATMKKADKTSEETKEKVIVADSLFILVYPSRKFKSKTNSRER